MSTTEITPVTIDEAKALTLNIVATVGRAVELIETAYMKRVWEPLGYDTWEAYTEAEFGGLRLPREERRQLVASLSNAGLSIRAIASAASASTNTVMADIEVSRTETPDPGPMPTEAKVIGLDGKRYERTTPDRRQAPRNPLPDQFKEAGWALRKVAVRIEKLSQDDRFAKHQDTLALTCRGNLLYAVDVCQRLLDAIGDAPDGPTDAPAA